MLEGYFQINSLYSIEAQQIGRMFTQGGGKCLERSCCWRNLLSSAWDEARSSDNRVISPLWIDAFPEYLQFKSFCEGRPRPGVVFPAHQPIFQDLLTSPECQSYLQRPCITSRLPYVIREGWNNNKRAQWTACLPLMEIFATETFLATYSLSLRVMKYEALSHKSWR